MGPRAWGHRRAVAALALPCAVTFGCAVPRTPAVLPPRSEPYVAVLSGEMPDPIADVARHAWIIAQVPGEHHLRRYELLGSGGHGETTQPFHYFGAGDVAVHGVVRMDASRLEDTVRCLERETSRYNEDHPTYFPIPGPNSNTFVDALLRHCDIHVELPITAIGRDYRGPIGASVTSAGTGIQLETWLGGIKVGLEEGVEIHLVGLGLGVHFWPPAITLPVNPGRIGIDDGAHASKEEVGASAWDREDEREFLPMSSRKYGVGDAWMFARYVHVHQAERAGGLSERATVGLSARGVLGPRFGYGFGLDVELGAGLPAGFAYGVDGYPVGLGYLIGPTGYVGIFGGVGVSGVTARVPVAFEMPAEVRLELDAGRLARVGFRAAVAWLPWGDERRGGTSLASFADELVFATFARFGKTHPASGGNLGRGLFFGLERREMMRTFWLGVTLGVEMDGGG